MNLGADSVSLRSPNGTAHLPNIIGLGPPHSPLYYPPSPPVPPAPPQAMIGSASPRSGSLALAIADDPASGNVPIRMDIHATSGGRSLSRHQHHHAAILAPQNAQTSPRALRARAGPSLIADSDRVLAPAATSAAVANSTRPTSTVADMSVSASASGGSRSTSTSSASSVPLSSSGSGSRSTAATRAPHTGVNAVVITLAAVGGAIALAVILALVYFLKLRRRVKRMKRCTNILGPELAPMWLSRSSQTSFDSQAKHDGTPSIFSPSTSDPNKQFLPIRASTVTVPASIEQRPREPQSPLRISTTIISPPPAARRGSIPSLNPRSPIRASFVTMTWPPSPTSRSGHYPEHDHGERPAHD